MTVSVGSEMSFLHSLEAEIDNLTCRAVKPAIQSSKDLLVIWRTKQANQVSLIVRCLELVSDKSHISMSAGSQQFFLIHVALLKFKIAYRYTMITHEKNCSSVSTGGSVIEAKALEQSKAQKSCQKRTAQTWKDFQRYIA